MSHAPRAVLTIATLCTGAFPAPVAAQVFEFTGGTSTLLHASGGSLEVHGANFNARLGVGVQGPRQSPRFGLFLEAPYRGFTWRLGDQSIPLVLPTDLFNRSYYFLGRGVGAMKQTSRSELFLYGGATSTGFYTPFFQAAAAQTPATLLFYERQLSSRVRGVSRNILSNRKTFIQGLVWTPRPPLRLALAAGVGSDQPFAAASLDLEIRWLRLLAAYGWVGDGFRRLPAGGFATAEPERENIQLQLSPRRDVRLTLSRQHYRSPFSGGDSSRSTVNGAGLGFTIWGVQTQGSVFLSQSSFGRSRAYSLGASRTLPGRLEVGATYFRSRLPGGKVSHSVVARLRETVSLRLSLTQVVTRGNGQTTVAWGGQLVSSLLTVGVDYQNIFLPLARAGQSQFRQVLLLNLRAPLPGAMRLSATTHVDPTGRARYTAYASGFAYGSLITTRGGGAASRALSRYLVRGSVVDTAGKPVAGAALRIDGDLVFTDSRGVFEVRKPKAKDYPIEVALDEFMFPGTYQVVSSPATAKAEADNSVSAFRVVLRRVR